MQYVCNIYDIHNHKKYCTYYSIPVLGLLGGGEGDGDGDGEADTVGMGTDRGRDTEGVGVGVAVGVGVGAAAEVAEGTGADTECSSLTEGTVASVEGSVCE